jgi:hypothetical protein
MLHLEYRCVCVCVCVCGAKIGTLRKVDHKYFKVLKCGAGEGWKTSVGRIV